jgi:predicted dinucleotide-binding enzyme
MVSTQKVAIIGLGNIGKIVAQNLVKGKRPIIIASKNIEDAKTFADELGSLATIAKTKDAIKSADIIVLSVWFNTIRELIEQYGNEMVGKIIIDTSNPIAPDENGGFMKIINQNESAGQINSALLPKNAKFVKAFGTLSAASLQKTAHNEKEKFVLFYASDDSTVDPTVEQLIKDSGFTGLKVGGIDQSIRIEVFGDLHEFGALGNVVNLPTAMAKI